MILQALVDYYETLKAAGSLPAPGWDSVKVSYGLSLGAGGELKQVVSLQVPSAQGKVLPQTLEGLPAPVKRSSGTVPNFLCDNSGYLLGVDNKGNPQRSLKCFAAAKELHQRLLEKINSPAAKAILAFFQTWNPENAPEHPALQEKWEDILSGGNLVFLVNSRYAQEDPEIRRAWEREFASSGEGPLGFCMVTGTEAHLERIHPVIKKVTGAHTAGAALVSFNAPAFCSYGKEQNLNAPMGKYAAVAYTTALNYLLSHRDQVFRLEDATVVCWAKGGGDAYQKFFASATFGQTSYSGEDLFQMLHSLSVGKPVVFQKEKLDPAMDFYILGISPHAARLSVRFFLHNTFGAILQNVERHYRRLEIVRPSYDKFVFLPVWKLLEETVNKNARDKSPSPQLAGETLRAILLDTPYPATLLNGIILRIRAEKRITRGRAAILKAYYLKLQEIHGRETPAIPEEVLQVKLNSEATHIPYTLGRLFATLESLQQAANPGLNATILDRYFNAASATPALIFPVLLNLAQKHLKKLRRDNRGLAVYYDQEVTTLCTRLGNAAFPTRLNLPEQGSFQLGYYQQKQARYETKEEKSNG